MQKSASAPNGSINFPSTGGSVLSRGTAGKSATSLEGVNRDLLPIGVSSLVASRMRHDATLSPAMLGLRMNTRNLVNEMKYNGGKIVSHQFALMRPRRNTKWEKPKDLDEEKRMRKLQKKVSTRSQAKERDAVLSQETMEKHKKTGWGEGTKEKSQGELEDSDKMDLDDPSLDIEISRLLKNPVIEVVWRTMTPVLEKSADGDDAANIGLPRNRVARALESLGHLNPEKAIVNDSLLCLPGDGPLDLNEFTSIVAVFNRQRRLQLREQFRRLDEDGSGTIGLREFRHLLWDLGYTVTNEAVQEYLNEADNDNSGEVEFLEFEHACQLVHQRHGFSKQEVEEFEKLFDRYDADGSNEMEADELANAMGWFGSPVTLEQAQAIIARFDEDGDGCLARPEFLMVMRQRLEDEISEMRTLFHEFDTDGSGTMDKDELLELFIKCGYNILVEVIDDAMKVVLPKVNKDNPELVFEDVLKVFYLVHKREGFSERELLELTDIFNRHDKMGKGELREFELTRCFNWMGYPLSAHRQRELWTRVDVDKTESIELGEFLKLIRLLRVEEENACTELLGGSVHVQPASGREVSHGAGQGQSHVAEADLKKMLLNLGYAPPDDIIRVSLKQSGDTSGDGSVDLHGCLGILRFIREKQVMKLRQCAGLSDQQASKIKGKFGLRVQNGKHIESAEFVRVVCDIFPVARHQPGERDKILNIIKEQTGGSSIKDLMEAYWIVRLYGDMREECKWNREQEAARDAGFTNWQVSSFREAFVVADVHAHSFLSQREIQSVFEDLMSLNLKQLEAMTREFNKMGERRDHVEFADFLRVMRIILTAAPHP